MFEYNEYNRKGLIFAINFSRKLIETLGPESGKYVTIDGALGICVTIAKSKASF